MLALTCAARRARATACACSISAAAGARSRSGSPSGTPAARIARGLELEAAARAHPRRVPRAAGFATSTWSPANVNRFEPDGASTAWSRSRCSSTCATGTRPARARRALARARRASSSCTSSATATLAYPYETRGADDWMARHFFSGGHDAVGATAARASQRDLARRAEWRLAGTHYARTAEAWLANLDASRDTALRALRRRSTDPARRRARSSAGGSSSWLSPSSSATRGGEEWQVAHVPAGAARGGRADEDRDRRRAASPGWSCAHLLHRRHECTSSRPSDCVGGHAHTVRGRARRRRPCDVDTGFVVYNERTYPLFTRLLAELGVATQPTEMSFSVRCERTGLEYSGGSLRGLFAQPRNLLRPAFLAHAARRAALLPRGAARCSTRATRSSRSASGSAARGYWRGVRRAATSLPMGAAIWSCRPGRGARVPGHALRALLREPRAASSSATARSGASSAAARALRRGARRAASASGSARCATRARGVGAGRDGVELALAAGATERFDHVVLAEPRRPGARAARRPDARRARDPAPRIRYEANDVRAPHRRVACCRGAGAPGRAWNYHVPARAARRARPSPTT